MKKVLSVVVCLILFACNHATRETVQQNRADTTRATAADTTTDTEPEDTTRTGRDSVALRKLLISMLKWDYKDTTRGDFSLLQKNAADSFYSGIDWKNYDLRVKVLKKTGFFSKEFMKNYHDIAVSIDNKIKQSKTKCLVGMQSYQDASEYCNCQYMPDNPEKFITIANIKNYVDSATFQWMWDSTMDPEAPKYTVKAQKEGGTWKISYMDSFTTKTFSPDFE